MEPAPILPSRRAWVWPTIEPRAALGLLAVFVGVAIAQGLASSFGTTSRRPDWSVELTGFVSGAIGAWVAMPIVQTAVANAREGSPGRIARVHVLGYLAFTSVHTSVMILLRALAGVLSARVASRFASPMAQATYEVAADVVLYAALAGLWIGVGAWRDRREAALRAERLERTLVQTRLDALSARLDPHFLFNTLHTLGALMHEDLGKSDRLLMRLGDLLRETLRDEGPLWTIEEERRHTDAYVEILRTRMGDRLCVVWSSEPGADAALVPRFTIQSLVENAVKHNETRIAPLTITIHTSISDDALVLHVRDDGDARALPQTLPAGHGLARLEELLRIAFGPGTSLVLGRASTGGAEVRTLIPQSGAR